MSFSNRIQTRVALSIRRVEGAVAVVEAVVEDQLLLLPLLHVQQIQYQSIADSAEYVTSVEH